MFGPQYHTENHVDFAHLHPSEIGYPHHVIASYTRFALFHSVLKCALAIILHAYAAATEFSFL